MTSHVQQARLTEGFSRRRESLAEQITESLVASIENGKLRPGEQLPSETKLADMFQVSRNTVREAIRSLIAQGILEARKGIGTFVHVDTCRQWPVETGIEELASTTEMIAGAGHVPGCRNYRFDVIDGSDTIAAALSLPEHARVYRLSRVRLADDQPVVFCSDFIAEDRVDINVIRHFKGNGSLFSFLFERCGLEVAVARTVIQPVLPEANVREALALAGDEPVLMLKQTHFAVNNVPFLYSENYINTSFMAFHVRRMPRSFFNASPLRRARMRDESASRDARDGSTSRGC